MMPLSLLLGYASHNYTGVMAGFQLMVIDGSGQNAQRTREAGKTKFSCARCGYFISYI